MSKALFWALKEENLLLKEKTHKITYLHAFRKRKAEKQKPNK